MFSTIMELRWEFAYALSLRNELPVETNAGVVGE